ncbi:MAG TPA: redoxin domain-containing protein, partial [Bacteroidales bacterium]|nr:redoxin domain-containing protein [Bacteroidales bacterium]
MALEGKRTLLSFHPLAWTSVCEIQMRSLDVKHAEFEKLGVIPYGISVDSVPCKKAWAESLGISKTNMLSDFWPHGEIAEKFGVFNTEE